MVRKTLSLALIAVAATGLAGVSGCATKKYVRQRVDERVTPVENRTSELEETSRRNSADISRLGGEVTDARSRADRAQAAADAAQSSANSAAASADQANKRVGEVSETLSNVENYTLQRTVTVTFRVGSARLEPDATSALDQLAAELTGKKGYVLEVQGFTDSTGSASANKALSDRRARAVYEYLAKKDVPLFRLHLLGYGEDRPTSDNTSRAGRAQNRRVEVRILVVPVADLGGAAQPS